MRTEDVLTVNRETQATMPHRACTILLVEDDLSLSQSLCQFLSDHGYKVSSTTTARHAWELIRSQQPRLVLLDLNLPDGSGLDVLRRISQQDLPTRAIVMTAFDLLHARPPAGNRALAGWMTKPVDPLNLLRAVEKALGPVTAGKVATCGQQ